MIFKNWLDTPPKMETHDPTVKTGTFAKSARLRVPKNGTSSAPIYERSPKISRNTPQNDWVDIWVMRFHFRASIKPIFENHVFRAVWSPFYPLKRPKNENGWYFFVYGSIILNFCWVAPLTYTPLVKRNKQNFKKSVFRDTLVHNKCSRLPEWKFGNALVSAKSSVSWHQTPSNRRQQPAALFPARALLQTYTICNTHDNVYEIIGNLVWKGWLYFAADTNYDL